MGKAFDDHSLAVAARADADDNALRHPLETHVGLLNSVRCRAGTARLSSVPFHPNQFELKALSYSLNKNERSMLTSYSSYSFEPPVFIVVFFVFAFARLITRTCRWRRR